MLFPHYHNPSLLAVYLLSRPQLTLPRTQTEKARAELAKAEGKFEEYRKDAGKKIDQADRKVEAEASKAKSGISSWFGGK